jgi:hypothetical protein
MTMSKTGNTTLLVFLSYSSKDQNLANRLKQKLQNDFGFRVFMATKDIKPTQKWRNAIKQELKDCQVFLALLTVNFRNSEWTDQETGMAIALGKVIFPLRVKKIQPHGFLEGYQYLRLKTSALDKSCNDILETTKSRLKIRENVQWSLISALNGSPDYLEANKRSERLPKYGPFDRKQVNGIFQGFLKNTQIHQPHTAGRNISRFLIKNRHLISAKMKRMAKSMASDIRGTTQGFDFDVFLQSIS